MRIVLFVTAFILLSSIVLAQEINTQYTENGMVKMQVNYDKPVIVRNDGIQSHFEHEFRSIGLNQWKMVTCPLPSRDSLPQQALNGLANVPLFTEAGNPLIPDQLDMSGGCLSFDITAFRGDRFRIGQASTVVEIQNGSAEFIVSPENQTCNGLECSSTVTIQNNDPSQIIFNSTDLTINLSLPYSIYYFHANNWINASNGDTINLEANETKDFKIEAKHQTYGQIVKYDVAWWYNGQNYTIDPFFISPTAAIDNAVIPFETQSFFSAWIDLENNTVVLAGLNTTGDTFLDPMILDIGVDVHSRVNLDWVNYTTFGAVWVNGTNGGNRNDVKATLLDTSGVILVPVTTIYENLGSNVDVDMAGMSDRVFFCFAGDVTDDMDFEIYDLDLNEILNEAGNEVDISADVSTQGHNLLACDTLSHHLVSYVWYDNQAGNRIAYTIINASGFQEVVNQELDNSVGNTAQVSATPIGDDLFSVGWYDSSSVDFEVAVVNGSSGSLFGNASAGVLNVALSTRVGMLTTRLNTIDDELKWFGSGHNATHVISGGSNRYLNFTLFAIPFIVESYDNLSTISGANYDVLTDHAMCAGTGVWQLTNNSRDLAVYPFYLNGSSWDGVCVSECPENWVVVPQACVGLQELIVYNDTSSCGTFVDLPLDNGTFGSCSVFDCQFNANEPFKQRMEWFCTFPETIAANNYNCVTTIHHGSQLLQTNPRPVEVEGVGVVNSFQEQDRLVNVFFTNKNLARDTLYNFTVQCHPQNVSDPVGSFTRLVSPENYNQDLFFSRGIWFGQNWLVIVAVLVVIVLVATLFYMAKNTGRSVFS
jgi:hypothetical protein